MSLNDTASGERVHIAFFGLRNAGKSSLVNAITGQELSLVSDIKGTTTDPVQKSMELLPLGPVVIIDTPGLDDEGTLGEMRVRRARQILSKTDLAVLVVDATLGLQEDDQTLCSLFAERSIPYLIAWNKCDLLSDCPTPAAHEIYVSASRGDRIHELKKKLAQLLPKAEKPRELIRDLLNPGDLVILVTPIDEAAPKGRLILPQQQTLREILDHHAFALVVQDTELPNALASLAVKPRLVVTDSQAFRRVSAVVPSDILLTSFSILFARYKGDLSTVVHGAAALDRLSDGDRILISEGCTHHRQCGDIGTVKLPGWLRAYTGKDLQFSFTSGAEFPDDLSDYSLVVHCGGCMLNEREMHSRLEACQKQNVPVTNYGTAIAQAHGILRRSLSPFPELLHQTFGASAEANAR